MSFVKRCIICLHYTGVNGNNVNIVDPESNGTDLWSSYEWSKSSQFNYFMVN